MLKDLIKPYLGLALAYTVALNILHLVSPLFMLQIYDRVLTSGSWDTLIFLSSIAVALLAIYAFADAGRRRVLALLSEAMGQKLHGPLLQHALQKAELSHAERVNALGQLTNLQRVFLNGTVAPVIDLPFAPLFLILLFLIHPLLGSLSLAGVITLCLLAYFSERMTSASVAKSRNLDQAAWASSNQLIRNRSVVISMGMKSALGARQQDLQDKAASEMLHNANRTGFFAGAGRSGRMILQALILAVGAGLVLNQQMSPGSIIAASLILGRALAPVDQIIGTLRQLISARQAAMALDAALPELSIESNHSITPMNRPKPQLTFEDFSVGIPSRQLQLVPVITHQFDAGAVVVVLGASGSGKSTLLRTLVGAHSPLSGRVRLGGRIIDDWDTDDRGRHIGYLPQDTQILRGTARENIGRFGEAPPEAVEQAARHVGAHEPILQLPQGYDTVIGEDGHFLSGGARQSLGLARALYADPSLIVLDEPTSSMDQSMRHHFAEWLKALTSEPQSNRRQTVFIATHDTSFTQSADQILILQNYQAALMSREQYMQKIKPLRNAKASDAKLNSVGRSVA